jgi:hypothetical protein
MFLPFAPAREKKGGPASNTHLLWLVSHGTLFCLPSFSTGEPRIGSFSHLARLGWLALVLNSLLFTLGHFWQPYNYLLIFLLVLPEGFPVYWKRNIKISILLHCTGNTLAA